MNNNSKLNLPTPSDTEDQIAIIGKAFEIKGDLVGLGTIIVSGRIEGNVSANQVVIEKDASILGNVSCTQLDISGQIRGQIVATDVIIRENANIEGDVDYSTLAMEGGGTISGKLKKSTAKSPSNVDNAKKNFAQQRAQTQQHVTRIDFPVDLSQKLRSHESRASAYITLADGAPTPTWINLAQDKLGLLVTNPQFQQFIEKGLEATVRIHIDTQYFDIEIPTKE